MFAKEGNPAAQTDALIRLSEAYRRIGLDEYGIQALEEALPIARQLKNSNKTASVLNALGRLYAAQNGMASIAGSGTGIPVSDKTRGLKITNKDLSMQYLNESLDLAKTEQDPVLLASVLNSRGIMYASRGMFKDAMRSFQECISLAENGGNKRLAAAAYVNYASAAIKDADYPQAAKYNDEAFKLYRSIPSGEERTGGLLSIGQAYRQLAGLAPNQAIHFHQQARNAFTEATADAAQSSDYRALSYALGYLGKLHEDQKELDEALHITRRALFAAQQVNAKELLSSWEWQIGRILRLRGDTENAIAAYRQAVANLQSVKQSLYAGCTSTSLSFKDDIEPVYKELTDLLLQKASVIKDRKAAEPYLLEARQTIETLNAAEMQDYFKNSCFEARRSQTKSAETLSNNTAIIYMISFPERIELLVSLPDGIKKVTVSNADNVISMDVYALRDSLTKLSDDYLIYSKRLYNALIRPLESDLQRFTITTLVVIPDNVFRTIPLAALHNGTDFLINKYAIATSLGMQLMEPISQKDKKTNILLAGISEAIHEYPALPYVISEMSAIKSLFDGEMLLNGEFSIANIKATVERKKYSILHMASHGEFTGSANNSYILAWDGPLTIDQFSRLVKVTQYKDEPLDLLTLSACKTAVGDDRAVLGIAGVAIKSGALSSLATLWEVDDKTTSELMVDFYRQLKTASFSKAQALQKAQIALLKRQPHPYYWSPFLLVGNWL
jgi:CHAT domain-containing protein